MRKAVVTGANGFIGSNLVRGLCEQNYYVYAVVKDQNENVDNLPKTPYVEVLYCELDQICNLKDLINSNMQIDIFYHLAWVGVSTNYKNDFSLQYKNIEYSLEAIRVAHLIGCKKFVSTGSLSECAYAEKAVDGTEMPSPSDYYSCSKISARYFCMLYAEQHNIDINWCLITSLYGPGRLDNNILTYTIMSLLKGEETQYTKLEQKWDYTYIDDLIRALILVGQKGKSKEIYAIGSGENKILKEYIEMIYEILSPGKELVVGQIPYKTSKIDNSIVDISKLVNDTGYYPSVSFEEGILKTIEYIKNNKK